MACGHQSRDERTGNCPVCWDTQIQRQMAMSSQQSITARQMAYENMAANQAAAQMRAQYEYYQARVAQPQVVEKVVEKRVLPSVEQIARALFETDRRVMDFVRTKAESKARDHESTCAQILAHFDVGARDEMGPQRWERVMRIAWERNEGGWRADAELRASEIRAVLLQSGGSKT